MRVGLFLGVEPRAGGMFQYAQTILAAVAALPSDRYSITVAYDDKNWEPILAKVGLKGHPLGFCKFSALVSNVLMTLRLPVRVSQRLTRIMNPVARELYRIGCDVWIFPAQESLAYQLGLPAVSTIHDLMHRYEKTFPEVSSKFRYHIREYRFNNLCQRSRAILVDSEVGRQHVLESYQPTPEKVFVLPYVAPAYLTNTKERVDFDSHYQLPPKFFFYPAQFWRHKNHLRLIEAIGRAKSQCPDISLVLSGGAGHDYEQVVRRAEDLHLMGSIRFVGRVPDDDLSGFYRRARGLVMPTFFGPTNIPPLEAMTIGCPVLTSEIYGASEQCGDAAIYFDPRSVEEMADAMVRLWRDDELCHLLSSEGRLRATSNTQHSFNKRLESILESSST